jgi:hypothetical protein
VEKVVEPEHATDYNIIKYMNVACRITKTTDTLRICNNFYVSTATMVTRMRLNVTLLTRPILLLLPSGHMALYKI